MVTGSLVAFGSEGGIVATEDTSSVTSDRGPWFWCLIHGRVEGPDGCPNDSRMGPYETRELAATALGRAHERTREWDAEEDAWRG